MGETERGICKSPYTELCKIIPARFWECLSEIMCNSASLGWTMEYFEGDSQNLAGMLLHYSGQSDYLSPRCNFAVLATWLQ